MARSGKVLLGFLVWVCICGQVFHAQPLPALKETVPNLDEPSNPLIPMVCQATRFPEVCTSSLSADSESAIANSTELVRIAIQLGWIESGGSYVLIQDLVNTSVLDINASAAAEVCEEALQYGATILAASKDSFLLRPLEDIQAWMSAALQFQYDCFSALSNVVNPPINVTMGILPQVNSTSQLISNALCMTDALAIYGSDPSGWLPPPESRSANLSAALTVPNPIWITQNESCVMVDQSLLELTPNVTVSLDGLSNYSRVQDAVDSAPIYSAARYIIYIKEGMYNETIRVHQNKTQIVFVGDGVERTILTGNKNAIPGLTTFQTATVVVVGAGFIARGITFQNTAGPNMSQAVAIRVDSDLSAFQDCSFDGYQDTLYAHTGRQFYKNCTILGTIDYIFGNAAAVFQNCQLVVRMNRPDALTSCVSAQGRTDPGQTTGLVFQNCTVTGTPEYMQALLFDPAAHQAFLGRPWKLFSRTIFLDTYMDSLIEPAGWDPWSGDFALDSLLYGEYISSGPGAGNVSLRVPWSNQLTEDQAEPYIVDNFIQGSWWLPCTGVPYFS